MRYQLLVSRQSCLNVLINGDERAAIAFLKVAQVKNGINGADIYLRMQNIPSINATTLVVWCVIDANMLIKILHAVSKSVVNPLVQVSGSYWAVPGPSAPSLQRQTVCTAKA